MANFDISKFDNLFHSVIKLETLDDARKFFEDICTIREMQDLAQRMDVARLLSQGKVYSEIAKITGASSATISLVNKCLMYGSDGYKEILERIKEED